MIELIAEVESVHDGSFGNALKLIDAAADSGASTVKFQTHIAEAETTHDAPQPPYFKAEPRFEYFKRTGFTLDQWKRLKSRSDENGVGFLSSLFSNEAIDAKVDRISRSVIKTLANFYFKDRVADLYYNDGVISAESKEIFEQVLQASIRDTDIMNELAPIR